MASSTSPTATDTPADGTAPTHAWGYGLATVRASGVKPNGPPLFSAHQMGTCRMGADAARSVVNPDGESWQVRRLFVADASTFPTPSGVNPQVTVCAVAHSIAQRVKAQIRVAKELKHRTFPRCLAPAWRRRDEPAPLLQQLF